MPKSPFQGRFLEVSQTVAWNTGTEPKTIILKNIIPARDPKKVCSEDAKGKGGKDLKSPVAAS